MEMENSHLDLPLPTFVASDGNLIALLGLVLVVVVVVVVVVTVHGRRQSRRRMEIAKCRCRCRSRLYGVIVRHREKIFVGRECDGSGY